VYPVSQIAYYEYFTQKRLRKQKPYFFRKSHHRQVQTVALSGRSESAQAAWHTDSGQSVRHVQRAEVIQNELRIICTDKL
jgi:hypothetical protein